MTSTTSVPGPTSRRRRSSCWATWPARAWTRRSCCSEAQRERTAEDLVHIVGFLATALCVDDPEVFTGFLDWTAEVLQARDVPVHSLVTGVDILAEQLHDFPRGLRLAHEGAAGLRGRPTGAVVPGTTV
ncbi:hypothetical protein ACPF8X_20230 [Streptomyces sp. G35A]